LFVDGSILVRGPLIICRNSNKEDKEYLFMGKGDKRSRRGKIFAGSFGKTRPKNKKKVFIPEPVAEKPSKRKAKAPAA
jgi:ribosomal small subunit protein bTHX